MSETPKFAPGRSGLAIIFSACLIAAPASAAQPADLRLHVPSPDWREQIIYFLMTDRFDDGNPANNDQGAGEYQPQSNAHYNGGDLAGVQRRLDYIQGLGATAVWITPPVANQWWDPLTRYSGYHGYWAQHFKEMDVHVGTLADYRRLSDALHRRGMYLIQDIVLNHTGNYFAYQGGWDKSDPGRFYIDNPASRPTARPTQWPFSQNDPRKPADRKMGAYHWTPNVADYTDPHQELNYQMSGLDDINTENPRVRRTLRDSYGYWIREVGVDAFRVDTVYYVPTESLRDFMVSTDPKAPGMVAAARATGRKAFHVFGEGFGIDKPFEDIQMRKLDRYQRNARGETVLPGMLNFPLYGAMGDVFARGRPPAELAWRIDRMMALHATPHLMPTFVDNHDVDRFLAGGSEAALRQSLLMTMTLPGIPTIYYGTEQGFTEQRAAMFAAGSGSGGKDHFNTGAPLYQLLADQATLRKASKVFTHGTPTPLMADAAGPGVLTYRMSYRGQQALIVFNTADHAVLLDNLETGLKPGTVLHGRYGLHGQPADLQVAADGRISLPLPPRAGMVWVAGRALPRGAFAGPAVSMAPLTQTTVSEDFKVRGQAAGVSALRLVVDGNLSAAQIVRPAADGSWEATVATDAMTNPDVEHRVTAYADEGGRMRVSATQRFKVTRRWQLLADVVDPAGDDTGPTGEYRYPGDPSWGTNRQLDLRRVQVYGSGGAMRIVLGMNKVTRSWNPQNGFDHVAFTVYVSVPGQKGGAQVLPLQNAKLPDGRAWHYRLRTHGWSNALFSAEGASADKEGTPITPAAGVAGDPVSNTVTLTLPAASLGGLRSLAGVQLYVTTWDYDGGYRRITPDGENTAFGGARANAALIMDDSAFITLPAYAIQ
ncbi:alpha-amylase family glycosyl hydrolase [Chitinimonas sp. BJYL2]|uniref:alpha-amylase family glycosyl hydrolase n=1 Tax=Chitinimonas sp. BJYL2 TaxID=2976696 RepID=UPI0022B2B8D7|nr:alpha-amylase family glycosyl hydrolase [Chitinimonas sp. BJYL2]